MAPLDWMVIRFDGAGFFERVSALLFLSLSFSFFFYFFFFLFLIVVVFVDNQDVRRFVTKTMTHAVGTSQQMSFSSPIWLIRKQQRY